MPAAEGEGRAVTLRLLSLPTSVKHEGGLRAWQQGKKKTTYTLPAG